MGDEETWDQMARRAGRLLAYARRVEGSRDQVDAWGRTPERIRSWAALVRDNARLARGHGLSTGVVDA